MRPRGESRSSPPSTYVGQVAVQNPQWTQLRRIFSHSAICGSASCARVKEVCIPEDRGQRTENRRQIAEFTISITGSDVIAGGFGPPSSVLCPPSSDTRP